MAQYMNKAHLMIFLLDMMDCRNRRLIPKLPPVPARPLAFITKDALLHCSSIWPGSLQVDVNASKSELYRIALVRARFENLYLGRVPTPTAAGPFRV